MYVSGSCVASMIREALGMEGIEYEDFDIFTDNAVSATNAIAILESSNLGIELERVGPVNTVSAYPSPMLKSVDTFVIKNTIGDISKIQIIHCADVSQVILGDFDFDPIKNAMWLQEHPDNVGNTTLIPHMYVHDLNSILNKEIVLSDKRNYRKYRIDKYSRKGFKVTYDLTL